MGDKKEYIERGAVLKTPPFTKFGGDLTGYDEGYLDCAEEARKAVNDAPAADVVEVEKVAEMLRAMFDDDCACNYNGNDEWLPHACEYGCTECPDAPEDNGCWKQFVKHFLAKMDGERKDKP